MIFGGLIYICFRNTNLLMFTWFKNLDIYDNVVYIRTLFSNKNFSNWFIYSLPDGIWIYSLTSFMILVWGKTKVKWPNKIWLYVGPILGIGAEVGQLLLIIPGTFDIMDLFLCIIASILPFFIIQTVE